MGPSTREEDPGAYRALGWRRRSREALRSSISGRIDWEKKFDAMPDTAPPKWMFNNIGAIRDNTARIIDLLEGETVRRGEPEVLEGTTR